MRYRVTHRSAAAQPGLTQVLATMGRFLQLVVTAALLMADSACASDYMQQNVMHFMQSSAITAHVRIESVRTVEELRDITTGRVGYKRFAVSATVIEGFKGVEPGTIEFIVTQEQPSDPPSGGQYIVSLNRGETGDLVFADDSVLWVPASPSLIAAARTGR